MPLSTVQPFWCRMKRLVFLLVVAAVAGCRSQEHRTQVDVGDGVSVSLVARPAFGIHSDWYRKLVVETPTGAWEHKLGMDSGWWRGSNLYRHTSGVYVLHEGQGGCVAFRAAPPEPVGDRAISCRKSAKAMEGGRLAVAATTEGFPASKFYEALAYIGQFVETPQRQAPISFIDAREQPEPELPDIM